MILNLPGGGEFRASWRTLAIAAGAGGWGRSMLARPCEDSQRIFKEEFGEEGYAEREGSGSCCFRYYEYFIKQCALQSRYLFMYRDIGTS